MAGKVAVTLEGVNEPAGRIDSASAVLRELLVNLLVEFYRASARRRAVVLRVL